MVSTKQGVDDNLAAMKAMESKTSPARLTLISHAPTIATRRASFPLDEPLLEGEIEKIAALGWISPRAQQVLCGPEKRASQTAEALGLTPLVEADLADIDYGSWSGKKIEDIQISDPDGLAEWLTNPQAVVHGGESLVQLIVRVERWMVHQTAAGHTLAVTHPAVIRAAILNVFRAPPESFWKVEIAPLSISDLRFNGRSWTVRSMGCSLASMGRGFSHL